MKLSPGEKVFSVINHIVLALAALAALYPFVYVLASSISDPVQVVTGKVLLFPKDITFASYEKVLSQKGIWLAYANTLFYTIAGTAASLLLTISGAYPLSKKRLIGGTAISFMVAFTIWINMSGPAGMIPFYLNLRDLGLLDNRYGVVIAFAITSFYVLLMRSFFTGVPDALEEAAKVDGASDWTILWRIYIPLSVPAMVTLGLFYAVSRWNGYFWTMIMITDESKVPLQVLLKKLIVEMDVDDMMETVSLSANYSQETIIYATIMVSIIPMIIVYPYIQKFFVKGLTIGSIKE
ncbi:carbohydrate ABC transporter permease [Paenibacillus sp. strain BS8-2]